MKNDQNQYSEFLKAKSLLRDKLGKSFRVQPVPRSSTLSIGLWHDDEVRDLFNDETWASISPRHLSYNQLSLYGVNKKGLLYYFPAILLSVLEDFDDGGGNLMLTLDAILTPGNFWTVSPADFDIEQRTCVCFLLDILFSYDLRGFSEWADEIGGFFKLKGMWYL